MSEAVEGGFKDKGQGMNDRCRAVSVGQIPCPLLWPLRAAEASERYKAGVDKAHAKDMFGKGVKAAGFLLKGQGFKLLPEASLWKDTNRQR